MRAVREISIFVLGAILINLAAQWLVYLVGAETPSISVAVATGIVYGLLYPREIFGRNA